MGRPPIGREAMTSSERQRRFLDRLRTAVSDGNINTDLKARIAQLEKQLAATRQDRDEWKEANAPLLSDLPRLRPGDKGGDTIFHIKRVSDWFKAQLDAGLLNADCLKGIGANAMHLAGVRPDPDQVPPLKKKIEMMGETIDRLEAKLARKAIWTKEQFTQLRKALHPDRRSNASADELHAAFLLLEQHKHVLVESEAAEHARKEREKAEQWRQKMAAAEAKAKAERKPKREAKAKAKAAEGK